jgi:uncharacterized membrane protein YeiH
MMDVTAASGTILNILQFIGTTAFAISGALVAGRRKMDLRLIAILRKWSLPKFITEDEEGAAAR